MNICPHCLTSFDNKRINQKYCCLSCKNRAKQKRRKNRKWSPPKAKFNCLECNSLTHNAKFCCRDCYAKYTKKNSVLKQYYCAACNQPTYQGWKVASKFCDNCRTNPDINNNYVDWSKVTIAMLKSGKNTFQYHARIRSHARSQINKTPCLICGYNNHIEICHIKPIKEFTDDTTIDIVNAKTNLVCLCPNHHWELDNGILNLKSGG